MTAETRVWSPRRYQQIHPDTQTERERERERRERERDKRGGERESEREREREREMRESDKRESEIARERERERREERGEREREREREERERENQFIWMVHKWSNSSLRVSTEHLQVWVSDLIIIISKVLTSSVWNVLSISQLHSEGIYITFMQNGKNNKNKPNKQLS